MQKNKGKLLKKFVKFNLKQKKMTSKIKYLESFNLVL